MNLVKIISVKKSCALLQNFFQVRIILGLVLVALARNLTAVSLTTMERWFTILLY